MKYDFTQKNVIKIKGKPEEIRDWIKEISGFMDGGRSYSELEDTVNHLERIADYEVLAFGGHHRIYFNNSTLMYFPNVSEEKAREVHFTVFKALFDEAKVKMDEKYSKKR